MPREYHNCVSCYWWEQLSDGDKGLSDKGKCRYVAPVCGMVDAAWPHTDRKDWCSKYKDIE